MLILARSVSEGNAWTLSPSLTLRASICANVQLRSLRFGLLNNPA